tara:strand:- start:5065 stop:5346 length:282 start_codon:yes stop_codon:yes gene_type:complete
MRRLNATQLCRLASRQSTAKLLCMSIYRATVTVSSPVIQAAWVVFLLLNLAGNAIAQSPDSADYPSLDVSVSAFPSQRLVALSANREGLYPIA